MHVEAGAPFTQAAIKFADREAVRDESRSVTFAELRAASNRVGSGFAALGLKQGDRVAVLAFNRTGVVELWLGLERANLVRVVMHSHFEMATHVRTLKEVGARALVFDERFAEAVADHRHEMTSVEHFVCLGTGALDWAISYESLRAKGSPADLLIDVDEEAPCFLQLTSGTTGLPKPWTHTHRSWRAVIAANIEHLDTFSAQAGIVDTSDVNLHFHALQWATGFQTLMPYLLRGARTVLMDDSGFDPQAVAKAFVEQGVTGTLVPAPMLPAILDHLEAGKRRAAAMKRMVIFFATPELLERTTRVMGPVWCHGFGSTEQGAPTTRLAAADVKADPKRVESVGRAASSFFELAIMDENGKRLPPGKVGEIVVRSAMSNGSYWRLPDKTARCFFPGGWFRPEDIGYVDEEGFLYYLDRAKDRVETAEGIVYPHVVETVLLAHDAVAHCGVVGLGESGSQRVVAAILLKKGLAASEALGAEILAHAAGTLAKGDRPDRIVFVEQLPTVLGGAKVQREVLKRQIFEAVELPA